MAGNKKAISLVNPTGWYGEAMLIRDKLSGWGTNALGFDVRTKIQLAKGP